jgi:hypothetical protein
MSTNPFYSEKYREKIFEFWYLRGKPSPTAIAKYMPADEEGRIPDKTTISRWVNDEFISRAEILDEAVTKELNARLVHEKVEMLDRHAKAARKMQDKAMELLETLNPDDFTSSSLIRLWTEGIRIERESAGIPGMLEKITNLSEESLVAEIEEIFRHSPIDVKQLEDANNG